MTHFDTRISEHLNRLPSQLSAMLADQFKMNDIVQISHLLPADVVDEIHEQANRLLDTEASRRDMTIASTGNTPRNYRSVGRDAIRSDDGVITAFFESEVLLTYLSKIAGEPLFRVPYSPEEYIINSQEKSGDTHGWHWDDYTFALIWLVAAPDTMSGGRVEYIPDTPWDKEDSQACLDAALTSREVRSAYISPGTCYLMRANTTLHRVAPLIGNTRRTVVVFTYASAADLADESITHDTMESIYSRELAAA